MGAGLGFGAERGRHWLWCVGSWLQLPGSTATGLGAVAQLLLGTWDLPGPGIEPVSPAVAGRFLTTEPLGKPIFFLN